MQNLNKIWKNLKFSQKSIPVILAMMVILIFGFFIPWMGFYWDDWFWMFMGEFQSLDFLWGLPLDRPLVGAMQWIINQVLGFNPILWQMLELVIWWLVGFSFYWFLKQLWPKQKKQLVMLPLLFLIYPAFRIFYISIAFYQIIVPYALFFFSMGFMVKAIRKPEKAKQYILIALILSFIEIFTTDYYYGLQGLRPFIIYLVIRQENKQLNFKAIIKRVLYFWWPFLSIPLIIFFWRRNVNSQDLGVLYETELFTRFSENFFGTAFELIITIINDFKKLIFEMWGYGLTLPNVGDPGYSPKWLTLLWGMMLAAGGGVYVYLLKFTKNSEKNIGWGYKAVGLGILSFLVGGIVIWIPDLGLKSTFPNHRWMLPLLTGASLIYVGILELFIKNKFKNFIFALLVVISVNAQFQNAVSFKRSWELQRSFFNQLVIRAPGFKEDVVMLSNEISEINYVTDANLTAPFNWIYDPDNSFDEINNGLFYITRVGGSRIPALEKGQQIEYTYRFVPFSNSVDNMILYYYKPPACLKVVHPVYDRWNPLFMGVFNDIWDFSNLELIDPDGMASNNLPDFWELEDPTQNWCYYFQKADLARQFDDWDEIVRLGDEVLSTSYQAQDLTEYAPFIQGYAFTGDFENALYLTDYVISRSGYYRRQLCPIWQDIEQRNSIPDEIILELEEIIDCQ